MGAEVTAQRAIGASSEGHGTDWYGRYELVQKLATGGMGEVYLARAVGAAGFTKYVVIKKILPHLVEHEQFVEGLIKEANLVVNLNHPNIVQVFDLGMEGRDYYMAMELVPGYNLATIAHYCAHQKLVIPAPACVSIAVSVLDALDYAHNRTAPDGSRQNVVHRDVSPQNVLISREGQVKLTDFGIAKVLDGAEGELTHSIRGKLRYMAPEALDGGRVDQRYDLFAAGIVLFEALCRRHLFGGRSDVEILSRVREARVPAITRYHPEAPKALQQALYQALNRDPSGRFQSAAAFATALRESIKPVSENEAAAQLRAFIADLYARDDFPLNRPKLPDLDQAAKTRGSRSIVLRSPMGDHTGVSPGAATVRERPRPRGSKMVVLLSSALVLITLLVAYLVYALFIARLSPVASEPFQPPVIIVSPRQAADQPVRQSRPVAQPGGDADASSSPDAQAASTGDRRSSVSPGDDAAVDRRNAARRSRRRVAPRRPLPFTNVIGSRIFGRHGSQLTACFDRHHHSGVAVATLRVVVKIAGDGKILAISLDPAEEMATELGRCVVGVVRNMRFPAHDQEVVTFIQPLTIRSGTPANAGSGARATP